MECEVYPQYATGASRSVGLLCTRCNQSWTESLARGARGMVGCPANADEAVPSRQFGGHRLVWFTDGSTRWDQSMA